MAFQELDEVFVRASDDEEYPGFVAALLDSGNLIVRLQGSLDGQPVYIEAEPNEVRF